MPPHPYLILHHRKWIVRFIVPPAVRHLFPDINGKPKRVIKRSTGESDIYRAQTVAAPIIAGIQREIAQAKLTLRPPIEMRAEALYAEYQTRQGVDAARFAVNEYTKFILERDKQGIERYVQALRGGIVPPVVAEHIQQSIGKRTPFPGYLDKWAVDVKVATKTRDEYRSAIQEFAGWANVPLETVSNAVVQTWVDYQLDDSEDDGLDAKTVNKKLSGLHNYWDWIGRRGYVPDHKTRKPFRDLDVKNAFGKVKIKPARYEPKDVPALWQAASGDLRTAGRSVRTEALTERVTKHPAG